MVDADYYTPVDSTFHDNWRDRSGRRNSDGFPHPDSVGDVSTIMICVQLKNGNGYDHNWVLNTKGDVTRKCASLKSPKTGIVLDVYTNDRVFRYMQVNFLDGSLTGKKALLTHQRASVCLETQKYPDTPNKPEWPSAVLRRVKSIQAKYLQILC